MKKKEGKQFGKLGSGMLRPKRRTLKKVAPVRPFRFEYGAKSSTDSTKELASKIEKSMQDRIDRARKEEAAATEVISQEKENAKQSNVLKMILPVVIVSGVLTGFFILGQKLYIQNQAK